MAKGKHESDFDSLFRLPLTDFIGARKALAAKLKSQGRAADAERVRATAKPSISAWAVNQLYWRHRQVFDRLLEISRLFRESQTSNSAGRIDAMRDALEARRKVLSELTELATTLLREAGYNPSLEMMRRIATTLEGASAYAALPAGVSAGRLTKDIDPPGFDSLTSLASTASVSQRSKKAASGPRSNKSHIKVAKLVPAPRQSADANRLKQARQARLAAARVSLLDAKKSLSDARRGVQNLEAAQRKADADVKATEKEKREAEASFKKASAVAAEAAARAKSITIEVQQAKTIVAEALRAVEKASRELESLFRGSA